MSDGILDPAACGCCAGTDIETPAPITNAPGLSTIAYRVGTWASFRESILARLSSSDYPPLAALATRDDDDFTIALADAFAVMADVLTFYQERIANEAYLRTATERRSVVELARLIAYEPAPGVAAETWLAFTLEEARGAPAQAGAPVTIPVGTRVQSVPGPDELPQTFEVRAAIEARVERNAIRVQTRAPQRILFGLTQAYLAGTSLQLAPGDILLIVGADRQRYKGSERWDVRVLSAVEPDNARGLTRVAWREPLGHASPRVEPADPPTEVFVFRLRAALFGHNAPNPALLSTSGTNLDSLIDKSTSPWRWKNFTPGGTFIDLDQQYQKIAPGSWVALVNPGFAHLPSSLPGYVELYNVTEIAFPSRTDFALSNKITRITPDTTEHLTRFTLRETLALAQSEPLALAEEPILDPLYGDMVPLATVVPDLERGQALAVAGKRQHLRIAADAGSHSLLLANGSRVELPPGARLAMAAPPARTLGDGSTIRIEPAALISALRARDSTALTWTLADIDGATGILVAGANALVFDPATDTDTFVAEIAFIADAADGVTSTRERTRLRLAAPLKHCYDRETVTINANLALAGHGEGVSEILGSGEPAVPNQEFTLRQAPLTWTIAETPTGRASTLEIEAGGTLWREVPTLFGASPKDRVFAIQTFDDGTARARFGDGVEGARLPAGQQNVRARYRKGLGLAGNVAAGKLTTLLTRPLGVTTASNPAPAEGGEDPEPLDAARENAPLTVLTLERAVSVTDYADFARSFAGIAKAHATWVAHGPARGVHVTVAGIEGSPITPAGRTWTSLMQALRAYGDPVVPLSVQSYAAATFRLAATVRVAADRIIDDVLEEVRKGLRAAFAFDQRDFGQTVSIDEVARVAHDVEGVEAIDVNVLRRSDQPASPPVRSRLFSSLPLATGMSVSPAEILVLDEQTLDIGAMT